MKGSEAVPFLTIKPASNSRTEIKANTCGDTLILLFSVVQFWRGLIQGGRSALLLKTERGFIGVLGRIFWKCVAKKWKETLYHPYKDIQKKLVNYISPTWFLSYIPSVLVPKL